ncbi:hypothetical protein [Thermogemmatispora tikiterensis]|uniref:hypothetical protein n=1 Tax=Thermogemmatispora tikiterensis TaxID=1825093 RepID=UPI0011BD79CD|nr:hypothetical protein [Thermogemmatispora tikiterensis]
MEKGHSFYSARGHSVPGQCAASCSLAARAPEWYYISTAAEERGPGEGSMAAGGLAISAACGAAHAVALFF